MTHKIMLWSMHALEVVFFTGLSGCATVVAISWVSIGRSSFSRDDESEAPAGSRRSPRIHL